MKTNKTIKWYFASYVIGENNRMNIGDFKNKEEAISYSIRAKNSNPYEVELVELTLDSDMNELDREYIKVN
jgi:hypothetical protein